MLRKKQVLVAIALTLVLSISVMGVALAQNSVTDLPGGGWFTGVQIQNVGTAEATVEIRSYDSKSTATFTSGSLKVPKDGSTTLLPEALGITAGGFQGSATASANQPMVAIVNTTNLPIGSLGTAGGKAAGQYQGVNSPDKSISFPLAKNNHFGKTTTFYIQNAGTTAVTAQADFKFTGGVTCSFTTPTIEPNRMFVLNATAAGCPSGDNTGLGSLTVTATEPLAGVVQEHGTTESPAVQLQATRGFAPGDADTKAYAPIIKTEYFNRFTGLQIQNTTTAPIDVTVTYKGSSQSGSTCGGQTYTQSKTGLGAGESQTFVHLTAGVTPANPMPTVCLASATVEATGLVVAIVNEAFIRSYLTGGGNGGRQEATTYSALAGKAATTKISAPLYKENAFQKGTGLQVQNVGTSQANVVATFISPNGSSYKTKPQAVPVGNAKTFVDVRTQSGLWDGTAMPSTISDANGTMAVVVTSDQPVVAIANESTYPFGKSSKQQDKNNYEGFNLTP